MTDATPADAIVRCCLRAEDEIETLRQQVRQLQLHGLHNDEAATFGRRFDTLMLELGEIRAACGRLAEPGEVY